MSREKAVVLWSGGKDSALALHEAQNDHDIVALVTTVTEEYDRISMHGVRIRLLEQQAKFLGHLLEEVAIPSICSNADYEDRMRAALRKYRDAGVYSVVCGDIFLEDVRRYREEKLFNPGMKGVFPLWGQDTTELARRFIGRGFRALLCCVDSHVLAPEFAGRLYDPSLLAELPASVDPCGEKGEFHSFVFDGPLFSRSVGCVVGERTLREDRFCYCDLLPATA